MGEIKPGYPQGEQKKCFRWESTIIILKPTTEGKKCSQGILRGSTRMHSSHRGHFFCCDVP